MILVKLFTVLLALAETNLAYAKNTYSEIYFYIQLLLKIFQALSGFDLRIANIEYHIFSFIFVVMTIDSEICNPSWDLIPHSHDLVYLATISSIFLGFNMSFALTNAVSENQVFDILW